MKGIPVFLAPSFKKPALSASLLRFLFFSCSTFSSRASADFFASKSVLAFTFAALAAFSNLITFEARTFAALARSSGVILFSGASKSLVSAGATRTLLCWASDPKNSLYFAARVFCIKIICFSRSACFSFSISSSTPVVIDRPSAASRKSLCFSSRSVSA